jgi:hypothetical protein
MVALRHSCVDAFLRLVVLRAGRIANDLLLGLQDTNTVQPSVLPTSPFRWILPSLVGHLCQLWKDNDLRHVTGPSDDLHQFTEQRFAQIATSDGN